MSALFIAGHHYLKEQLVKAVKNIWKSCCLPETLLMSQGQQNPWQKDFAFNHWAQKTSHKMCTFDYFKVFFHLKKTVYACYNCYVTLKKLGTLMPLSRIYIHDQQKEMQWNFFFFISYISALSTNSTFPFYFSRILKIKDAKVHNSVFLWFRSPRGSMKRVWWSFGLRTIHHLLFLSLQK